MKLYFSLSFSGINLPPKKCLPLNSLTPNLGKVNEIKKLHKD